MSMLCRQCEQTVGGKCCTTQGVCGKDADTAALQDLLIYAARAIAVYGKLAFELEIRDKKVDKFLMEALFATVTNVDFDPARLEKLINKAYQVKTKIANIFLHAYKAKHGREFEGSLPEVVNWQPADSLEALIQQGKGVGILADSSIDPDLGSLQELFLYGLKGMAAYADHAAILGSESEEVSTFFYKGLSALTDKSLTIDDFVVLNMELGKVNLKCMEILDHAHTNKYGHPRPTQVSIGFKKGPAIIVSGHDLLDLEQLLKQTESKGINVYTTLTEPVTYLMDMKGNHLHKWGHGKEKNNSNYSCQRWLYSNSQKKYNQFLW